MSLEASIDLCTVPAGTSPNGLYNFDNPTTMAPAIISVGVILCTVSSTLTVCRVFVNRKKLFAADCMTNCMLMTGWTHADTL